MTELEELHTNINTRLGRTIMALYVATLAVLALGTLFALQESWRIRLDAIQANLVRTAGISNLLVETALVSSEKTLHTTKLQLESAMSKTALTNEAIHKLLAASVRGSNLYKEQDGFGLLFYADANGQVFARSDTFSLLPINIKDRFYFDDLRDHLRKNSTVGPLVRARTTGEWVFHLALPLHDATGQFAGVLVQQIKARTIGDALMHYTDPQTFTRVTTHFPGSDASFVYPSNDPNTTPALAGAMLTGSASSPVLSLISVVALPKQAVIQAFIRDNIYLIAYALSGALVITAFFLYLHQLIRKLVKAQVYSLRDALTGLHNRRALDDQLPLMLRESMRAQLPLTVLFIDIDLFRLFNQRYGHEVGDTALQEVAQALSGVCQRPLDFICRWGGEEFVAVLPHTNDMGAEKIAGAMLNAVRQLQLQVPEGPSPQITVSIGHITAIITPESFNDDLVGAADIAMLQAKHLGRNRSVASSTLACVQAPTQTCPTA